MQEVSTEPVDRHPRRGDRRLPAVAALAAVPRDAARAGAPDAGAHLLQVRGRVAGRVAQAEHRRAAGLLQQGGRHPADRHRDRRRSVGLGDGDGLQLLRARVRRLHGAGVLRPEAVPADLHGDLRRGACVASPSDTDEQRALDPGRAPGLAPARSASRSARPSRTPPPTRTRTTPWAACSATCCCTSRSSGSRPRSRWSWRARSPT